MFEFGEELMIESNEVPWLILIQLLVTFLLIFLLYSLSFVASDLSTGAASSSAGEGGGIDSSSTSRSVSGSDQFQIPIPKYNSSAVIANCLEISQEGQRKSINGELVPSRSRRIVRGAGGEEDIGESESINGELVPSRSRRIVRGAGGEEDIGESEGPSSSPAHLYFHPCNYFRFARLAFLKCFGLDSSSENSTPQQRKRKELRKRKES